MVNVSGVGHCKTIYIPACSPATMHLRVVGGLGLLPLLAVDAVGAGGGEETAAALFASGVTTALFAADCTAEAVTKARNE